MKFVARRGVKYVFGLPGSGFPMDAGRKAGAAAEVWWDSWAGWDYTLSADYE